MAALQGASPGDPAALYRAGVQAVRAGHDEAVMPIMTAAAARYPDDPRLAQVLGLAARNFGDLSTAVEAFARAHTLAPPDALIAHSLARCRLEAGLPAIDAFETALRLVPSDASVIQGLAAARFAAGDAAGAAAGIDQALRQNPLWLDGHATLARLRRAAGEPDDLRSYRKALQAQPRHADLWLALATMTVLAERHDALTTVVNAARGAIGLHPALDLYEAIAADETGQAALAATLFARLPAPNEPSAMVWHVRHLLRAERLEAAGAMAEGGVDRPGGRGLWPYLALVWRLRGDPRWHWLEGVEQFVRVVDLDLSAADLVSLTTRLRALHVAREQPLDQSVRGGTQTDGPLLFNIAPEIQNLRRLIDDAIVSYVAALPAPDPRHPLLAAPRDRIRFAGSWSVRLTGGGYHADHIHPQGWISSALYIGVPETAGHEGWLTLGSSQALLPALPPFREIEPKPGRLVLFPSTMWHGTRRFAAGERLTVAFDVALTDPR